MRGAHVAALCVAAASASGCGQREERPAAAPAATAEPVAVAAPVAVAEPVALAAAVAVAAPAATAEPVAISAPTASTSTHSNAHRRAIHSEQTLTIVEPPPSSSPELANAPDSAYSELPLVDLSASAHDPLFADGELVDRGPEPAGHRRPRRWGVSLDVGAPDGATVALVARPLRTLEVAAGMSYNGVSEGGRGEVTWAPLDRVITPTASLAIGHFADGDANPLARLISGNPMFSSPLLYRIGYDYESAQVGFEVGRRVTFYLRAGASRITGSLHNISELGGKMAPPITGADPSVTILTASARLGLIVRFAR